MIVAELMTKTVISVAPDTNLSDAARIMLDQHLSGLPVIDRAGTLVGVVTEGDLLRRAELDTIGSPVGWLKSFLMPSTVAADFVRTHGRRVSEIMSDDPITVTPETSLQDLAMLMRVKKIKRVPVVKDGAVVGVIARVDLLKALALKLIEVPEKMTDAEIAAYINKTIAMEKWAPKTGMRIAVHDHVVDLEGVIFSNAERDAVRVIAENAPGVKEVHDHLMYVDPGSGMAFPTA